MDHENGTYPREERDGPFEKRDGVQSRGYKRDGVQVRVHRVTMKHDDKHHVTFLFEVL